MITLTCTNCKAQLEMDDAFAGGVCRCMYCGTIQTVPSHLKRPGAAKKVKALYKQNPRAAGTGGGVTGAAGAGAGASELDQIADVVAHSGSGLSGSGLGGSGIGSGLPSPRVRASTIAPPKRTLSEHLAGNRLLLVAAAGAVCSLVVLSILLFAFSGRSASPPHAPIARTAPPSAASLSPQASGAMHGEPNFCGVGLAEDRVVVYVLDRGSATGELFGHLKEACYRSIDSLDDRQKFQIIFWSNGSGDDAFPGEGPALATPANLDAARRALDEVHAHGQSDATPALTRAFAVRPDVIVLATGKAYDVDDGFVQRVEQMSRASGVKIHTFALGASDDAAPAFRQISRTTGGEHRLVPAGRLREFAQ